MRFWYIWCGWVRCCVIKVVWVRWVDGWVVGYVMCVNGARYDGWEWVDGGQRFLKKMSGGFKLFFSQQARGRSEFFFLARSNQGGKNLEKKFGEAWTLGPKKMVHLTSKTTTPIVHTPCPSVNHPLSHPSSIVHPPIHPSIHHAPIIHLPTLPSPSYTHRLLHLHPPASTLTSTAHSPPNSPYIHLHRTPLYHISIVQLTHSLHHTAHPL